MSRGAAALESELDVPARREVREEGVALKYGADVALVGLARLTIFAVEQDVAGSGLFEAGDQPEGGRLAAAGRADQREKGALRNVERDAFDRPVPGIVFDQLAEFEKRTHRLFRC